MTTEKAIQIAEEHVKAGRTSAGERLAGQVLASEPGNAQAMGILGVAAFTGGRLEDAWDHFRKAIENSPSPSALQCHRAGEVLRHLVRVEESIAWLERAIAIQPDFADAHVSLSLSLLTLDRYERGFAEFEWRWKSTRLNTQRIEFKQPAWDGGDPKGRTILLWAEQGLGDVIHAARYAKLMANRGAKVVVGCQQPLSRVMRSAAGVSFATSQFEETPAFDLHVSSFSLMRAFRTTYETIPAEVPYVHADPVLVEQWKSRLSGDPGRLKVGLVWGGSVTNPSDANRSIPVTGLAPLAGLKDVSFYSLQTDQRAAEASAAPAALQLKPVGHLLTDFAETAALLMNLDLLISVDTAAVHLAGAMGRPAWALLAHMNDWRWGLNRRDNRWYPTARLFRQRRRGDWNQVMNDVAAAMRDHLENPSP